MLVRNFLPVLLAVSVHFARVASRGTSSLAFVIDDTRSMGKDIAQVKQEAGAVMDIVLNLKSSQIKDIVLVTFNDPEYKLIKKTKSREELKAALNEIEVHNYSNYDCPEASLSGLKLALHESEDESYIYVFTDASARDYKKMEEVRNLAQSKQSQVVFVLTGDCRKPNSKKLIPYYEIAAASGGQVFRVDKDEVQAVLNTIKETIRGKKSLLTWKVVPAGEFSDVPFTIDDKTEYAVISTSGTDVILNIEGPSVEMEKVMWTNNVKVVKLINPVPGSYIAKVKGTSGTSVAIYARTEFTFQPGFSEVEPNRFDDTSRQPIGGTTNYLSIKVTDPDNAVAIKIAEIMDMDDKVITVLPLTKNYGNFYTTDLFIAPENTFRVAVNGTVIATGKPIRRISKTIVPKKPIDIFKKKAPIVSIAEGLTVAVPFDGTLQLTCQVTAYPLPKIIWKNNTGDIQHSKSFAVEPPYKYTSYLKLNNFRTPGSYRCEASNEIAGDNATVTVSMEEPFVVGPHIDGTINVKHGDKTTLHCNITSASAMEITWYLTDRHDKTTKLSSSYKYTITSDGTALNIVAMDADLVGKYTCKAALLSDESVSKKFSADVNIYGVVVPVLDKDITKVEINEEGSDTIRCVILDGVPKPKITWQYKVHGSDAYGPIDFNNMEIVDDVILVFNAELENSGDFKCIAKNSAGDDDHVIELVVTKKPVATILEGRTKTVEFGNVLSLTCKVTASPDPKIVWKDNHGKEINSTKIFNDKFDFVSTVRIPDMKRSARYYCIAENNQGKVVKTIVVKVPSAFTVFSYPEAVTVGNYSSPVSIVCNIQSSVPMAMTWYHMNNVTNEMEAIKPETSTKSTTKSSEYIISEDGTELTIKHVGLNHAGKYSCEASLISDPTENISFDTDVQVVGLRVPELNKTNTEVSVEEGSPALIDCKASESTPKPKTSWQFKKHGSDKFLPITGSEYEHRIGSATLDNAGYYRCIVTNAAGQDNKTTELIVNKKPVMTIDEKQKNMTVPYGGEVTVTCTVVGHPEPTILWKDNKGNFIPALVSPGKNAFEYTSNLRVSNVKKPIKYKCEADNSQGKVSDTVNVTVSSPFTVDKHPDDVTNVEYGTDHKISCSVHSRWPMKIDWFLILDNTTNEEPVEASDKYSIVAKGTELIIRNVTRELVGNYTCKASLLSDPRENKSFKTNLKITGLVIPEVNTPIKVTAEVDNDAAITCKIVKGSPKPTITWQFQSQASKAFVPIVGSNEVLHIAKVALNDSGNYKCVAENIEGKGFGVTELIVEAPPKINLANNTKIYEAVEGDVTLRIPCNITGYPKPAVTWSENGKPIRAGGRYTIEDGALFISRPIKEDSGKYTCEAKNRLGAVQETFEGVVTPYPENLGNRYYVYLLEGENRKVYCNASDTDSVRWYTDDGPKGTGAYISFENATDSMDGNYTCRASNKMDSHTETYVVDVGYPPKFISVQETPIVNWHGNEVLNCAADAKPDAKTVWVYNGVTVNTTTDEFQFDIIGWGQYTCRVSNVHDTIERSFNVTSTDCLVNRTTESVANTPLLVTEALTWPHFDNKEEFLIIPSHEKFNLMCTRGFKKFPGKTKLPVSCYHEDTFWVNGNLYKYADLRCKEEVKPIVVKTGEKCLFENTETIKVGFNVTDFIEVYKVCYDNGNDVPLSSFLRMSGEKDMNDIGAHKWFKYPGIGDKKIDKEYTCVDSSASCCYSKDQMVNFQDVNFGPPQTSTFIDHLNAVPIWIPCTGTDSVPWQKVEEIVRSQLSAYPEFDVFSGASKYTSKNGGLIPRYLWKVVRFFEEDSLAIISVNDPSPTDADLLCENICSKGEQTWINFSNKFTYCCDLEEFLTAFELPESIVGDKSILDSSELAVAT